LHLRQQRRSAARRPSEKQRSRRLEDRACRQLRPLQIQLPETTSQAERVEDRVDICAGADDAIARRQPW
jgi:hypothetical protein